jgi:hypothetical protein
LIYFFFLNIGCIRYDRWLWWSKSYWLSNIS